MEASWRTRTSQLGDPMAVLATMLASMAPVVAIRPVFARWHDGSQLAMQAFVTLGMAGAIVGAPVLGRCFDGWKRVGRAVAALALCDALLSLVVASPLPTGVVLGARLVQGAVNIGLLTALVGHLGGRGQAALAGAAVTAGIALGPVVGGLLVHVDPRLPFGFAAALLALVAAWGTTMADAPGRSASGFDGAVVRLREVWRGTRAPALLGFAERFVVGSFVVTFALRGHGELGLTDRSIGMHQGLFVIPFALAAYPAARLAARFGARRVVGAGGTLYALGMTLVGVLHGGPLTGALVVAGLGAALVFVPSLRLASEDAPAGARSAATGLFHAAGAAGMMVGSASAALVVRAFSASGASASIAHGAVFVVAGAVMLGATLALAPTLSRSSRRNASGLVFASSPLADRARHNPENCA